MIIEQENIEVQLILNVIFANRYLPVVCHHLAGYDSHLSIEQIYQLYQNKDILSIPTSYEKLMSFKIGELKFIDRFQFMASSIEKLSENLYTKDYKPHLHCEDNDKDKEYMQEYIEYMETCEPGTLKNKYECVTFILPAATCNIFFFCLCKA